MDADEYRECQPNGDVDIAGPGAQDVRARIVKAKCGQDQQAIDRHHQAAGDTISVRAPAEPHMQGIQRAQQHERNHGSAAVDHQEIGGNRLPSLASIAVLERIRHQPHRAAREQRRKQGVDRAEE